MGSVGRKPVSIIERVFARCVADDSGCIVWTGARARGYGQVCRREGGMAMVHRVVYETFVGPIPHGFQVDHLCKNRACCRTDHLEAVTARVNLRRAKGWTFDGEWVCGRGHRVVESAVRDGVRCKQCLDGHRSNYMAARKGRRR